MNLAWHYAVIRLWELDAEQLLALGRPALLALIGQTRIAQPEVVLPQVIATFKTVPDREQQYRLLAALIALMSEKELLPMIEKVLEQDDLFSDMPYLQRIQEKYEEGREAGREEGREEGRLAEVRENILDILQLRFSPSTEAVQQITAALDQVVDESRLRTLLRVVVQAAHLAAFQAVLVEQQQQEAAQPENENGAA